MKLYHLPLRRYANKIGQVLGSQLEVEAVYHHFYRINRKAAAGGDFSARKAVGEVAEDVRFPRGNGGVVRYAIRLHVFRNDMGAAFGVGGGLAVNVFQP